MLSLKEKKILLKLNKALNLPIDENLIEEIAAAEVEEALKLEKQAEIEKKEQEKKEKFKIKYNVNAGDFSSELVKLYNEEKERQKKEKELIDKFDILLSEISNKPVEEILETNIVESETNVVEVVETQLENIEVEVEEKKTEEIVEQQNTIEIQSVATEKTKTNEESSIVNGVVKQLYEISPTKNIESKSEPSSNNRELKDIEKKIKYLEDWLYKVSMSSAGSGEVRLEFLDDVDRNSAKISGRYLKYDSTLKKWVGATAGGGGGASVTVSATAPLGASEGDLWWSTTDDQLYLYYNSIWYPTTNTSNIFAAANTALTIANLAFDKANSASNIASSAFDQANTARNHANSGFTQANVAVTTANTAYNQANTAYTHANGAFITANAAFDAQNVTSNVANAAYNQANTAYNQANTAYTHANGAFITANAAFDAQNVTSNVANAAYNQANTAYNQANTAYTHANGAFITANAAFDAQNVTSNVANAAYNQANTAYTHANGAFITANAAFDAQNVTSNVANAAYNQANTAYTHANGAFITANAAFDAQNVTSNVANAAYNQANTAYNQANTAYTHANGAFITANAAFDAQNVTSNVANAAYNQANTAYTHANDAFITANAALPNSGNQTFYGNLVVTGTLTVGVNTVIMYGNAGLIVADTLQISNLNVLSVLSSSYDQANAAFNKANTGATGSNSVVYISDTAPDSSVANGFLWWNSGDGSLYINYGDGNSKQWVVANPFVSTLSNTNSGATGSNSVVYISDTAPDASVANGFLWWNSSDGSLYINYGDGNSKQWVVTNPFVSTTANVGATGSNSVVHISDTAPDASVANGFLWWNSSDGSLYINYGDGNSKQWVVTNPFVSATANANNSNLISKSQLKEIVAASSDFNDFKNRISAL